MHFRRLLEAQLQTLQHALLAAHVEAIRMAVAEEAFSASDALQKPRCSGALTARTYASDTQDDSLSLSRSMQTTATPLLREPQGDSGPEVSAVNAGAVRSTSSGRQRWTPATMDSSSQASSCVQRPGEDRSPSEGRTPFREGASLQLRGHRQSHRANAVSRCATPVQIGSSLTSAAGSANAESARHASVHHVSGPSRPVCAGDSSIPPQDSPPSSPDKRQSRSTSAIRSSSGTLIRSPRVQPLTERDSRGADTSSGSAPNTHRGTSARSSAKGLLTGLLLPRAPGGGVPRHLLAPGGHIETDRMPAASSAMLDRV
eukprot:TRINITY_DN123066_c0_g1_i1.p1 TRINITY_DN123066_c0_g1~~TRINITY_DN123066_c0_g1_i1.p1  ORF type:complete len:360 (-),score=16.19 TRINITY_DN123066_c0_g1_i1:67-1011(-)